MIKTSTILFVLFYLTTAHSQQTIDKLNSNQLKLPKETISKALSIDATGQVKSSATSDTELGYLSGVTSAIQDQINDKANDADAVHLTGDESIAGVKTLTGKLVTSSTVNASIPCPVMTQTQRDAIATPVAGDCVFNSDTSLSNIYDGAIWKAMGGSGGGIGLWVTANGYAVDDVVIESNNIYICLTAHTSGTFATDLASLYWLRLSTDVTGATGLLPLATGGTNKSITASDGSIVYSDADSLELLAPGTGGQILQTNGAAAPTFVNKSISGKAQNTTAVTLEEMQVPNNLLTATDTNKYLNETGNTNILSNPSFEHSTFSTSWTNSAGTFTQETSVVIDGKASAKLVLAAQTMSLTQSSTLYAAQFADGVQGLAMVRIKSDIALKVCSIQAGTVSTTNCVTTATDSKWGLYKIPFVMGATSQGISIASTGSLSGTVYVDDAFVGGINLESQNGACITSDCTTTFSAKVSPIPALSDLNISGWATSVASSGVNSHVKTLTIPSGLFTVVPNCLCNVTSVATTADRSCKFDVTTSTTTSLVFNASSNNVETNLPIVVSCQKQGADFTQAEAKKTGNVFTTQCGANCVDSLSAYISTTPAVSRENVSGWITSVSKTGTNNHRKVVIPETGLFTSFPNCSCTVDSAISAADKSCKIDYSTSTVSSLVFHTSTDGVAADSAIFISCQKTGADFVATRNIIGSFNEVVTSPGISKPKVCHYAFGGAAATLASPTVCTTGTCVETYDSCNAISPPAFVATGIYGPMTIASGTFANNSLIQCDCRAWDTAVAAKYCAPYFSTGQDSWKTNASGGYALQSASFTTGGGTVNSYFQYTCTGSAP